MKKLFIACILLSVAQIGHSGSNGVAFPAQINGVSTGGSGLISGIDIFYAKHNHLRGLNCYLTVRYSYNVVANDGDWYGLLSEHWNYRPKYEDKEYVARDFSEARKLRTDEQSRATARNALKLFKRAGICSASSDENYIWSEGERAKKQKEAAQQREQDKADAQERVWESRARQEQERERARERQLRNRETEDERRRKEYL